VDVAPRTGKFINNFIGVFKRGENLQQNAILYFVFSFTQSSIVRNRVGKLEFTLSERGLALKGLAKIR